MVYDVKMVLHSEKWVRVNADSITEAKEMAENDEQLQDELNCSFDSEPIYWVAVKAERRK